MTDDHKNLEHAVNSCVQCGKCLARCPIYRATRDEKKVARGRVTLTRSVLDGSITDEQALERAAEHCLYCGSCTAACPYDMPMDRILPLLRERIAGKSTVSRVSRKVVDSTLGKPSSMKSLFRTMSKTSPPFMKHIPRSRGVHLRFSLPNVPSDRYLPALAKTPFMDTIPSVIQGDKKKPVVGWFVGCLHNYVDLKAPHSILKILQKLGVTVKIPENQSCCGLPFYAYGLRDAFENHAEQNISAFGEDCDVILSGCPTCVSSLKHHYSDLGESGEKLADKVMDLPSFLWEQRDDLLNLIKPLSEDVIVTWHDPCHLAKGLKVTAPPRNLLKHIFGEFFREMDSPDFCCGGGGSFSLTNYDLSRQIGKEKLGSIENLVTPADTTSQDSKVHVVSACPGCEIQLNDLVHNRLPSVRIRDLFDVIAENL